MDNRCQTEGCVRHRKTGSPHCADCHARIINRNETLKRKLAADLEGIEESVGLYAQQRSDIDNMKAKINGLLSKYTPPSASSSRNSTPSSSRNTTPSRAHPPGEENSDPSSGTPMSARRASGSKDGTGVGSNTVTTVTPTPLDLGKGDGKEEEQEEEQEVELQRKKAKNAESQKVPDGFVDMQNTMNNIVDVLRAMKGDFDNFKQQTIETFRDIYKNKENEKNKGNEEQTGDGKTDTDLGIGQLNLADPPAQAD